MTFRGLSKHRAVGTGPSWKNLSADNGIRRAPGGAEVVGHTNSNKEGDTRVAHQARVSTSIPPELFPQPRVQGKDERCRADIHRASRLLGTEF